MTRRGVTAFGAITGTVSAAATLVLSAADPRRAVHAWLAAFVWGAWIAAGALLFVMIGHVARARWFVLFRRTAGALAATLPAFLVMAVPIGVGRRVLYPWVHNPDARHGGWYASGYFIARGLACLALWIAVAEALRRWSLRQDASDEPKWINAQRALSAGAMPAMALTMTLAAFDWVMSLDPGWYSNVFGLYLFAGAMVAAVAAVVVLVALVPVREGVSVDHLHALGRLLLTFVVFWAYIAFSQLLIIWIADLPAEVGWYRVRGIGPWATVAFALGAGHFAIPFSLLLNRGITRNRARLTAVALWLLVAHYLDAYWLVMPAESPASARPHLVDLTAWLAVTGLSVAVVALRYDPRRAVPVHDPERAEALAYRSP